MKKKIALGIVVAIAIVFFFRWNDQQVQKIQDRQIAQYDASHPLPKFDSLFFLHSDLCSILESSDIVSEDYLKIRNGFLLEQDLLPAYKDLNDVVAFTLSDIKSALPNLPGNPPSPEEALIENKMSTFRNTLNKSFLELEVGDFGATKKYFNSVPGTVTALGTAGCKSKTPTVTRLTASSSPAFNQFVMPYRDLANTSVCKLKLSLKNILDTSFGETSKGASRNVLVQRLKSLADQLQEASQSTEWAYQELPLPGDEINIKTLQTFSKAVYKLRVRYYLKQIHDFQFQFNQLAMSISPIAVKGCSKIKS